MVIKFLPGWRWLRGNKVSLDTVEPIRSDLRGKRLFVLGSSVTWGFASGGVALPEFLAQRFGLQVTKDAVNGTSLAGDGADTYVARLRAHTALTDDVDIFLLQLSTKDARLGYSTAESIAAIEQIIDYVHNQWQAPVIMYTNAWFKSDDYAQLVTAVHDVQVKRADFEIIDLFNNEAFNSQSRTTYMANPIHPTRAGYIQWWGPQVAQELSVLLHKLVKF